jgi:hypothetical protein
MRLLPLVRTPLVVAGVWLGTCRGASTGEFTIDLKLQAGRLERTASSGKPADSGTVFAAKVTEVLSVQWAAVNGAPRASLSDITLHVFMDRMSTSADTSKPGPAALYESAVILDFEPGAKSIGEFRMRMPEPGTYLVRAETIGAAKKLGKEVAVQMPVSVQ